MSHDSGRFLDHLYEMDDTEFEHVYEMTKRESCVRFGVEAFTVGYQDAFTGRAESNGYADSDARRDYKRGYLEGAAKRRMRLMAPLAREFGEPAVWL